MKIAIIGTFLGQKTSGAEMSSFLLTCGLKKKLKVFAVTAKVKQKLPFKLYSLNLDFLHNNFLILGTKFTDYLMFKRMLPIIKKKKPDIIHIQDFLSLPAAVKVGKRLNIPTVMTVRDYRFNSNLAIDLEKNKIVRNYSKKQYYSWLYQTLKNNNLSWLTPFLFFWFYASNKRNLNYIRKVDGLITVSDFVKKELIKSGFSENKIKTIKVPKPDWIPKKSINKDYIRIFCGGFLVRPKGFHLLIKSMKKVVQNNSNVKLFIAGEGSCKQELINMSEQLGLKENIEFLGRVNPNKMKEEYIKSDFVVVPSIWPEPLSRMIFESFSLAKPVIATNVGGSAELVKNGVTGYLVSPYNLNEMSKFILKLVNNPNKIKALGKNALKLINKDASATKCVNNHIDYYNYVIQNRNLIN